MTSATTTVAHSDAPDATVAATVRPTGGSMENPVRRGPVLVALHGAESSRACLNAGRLLAERLKVELHVVTVIEPLPMYGGVEFGVALAQSAATGDFGQAQEGAVRREIREVMGDSGKWTMAIRHGQPAREIDRVAEELNATLIIVDASPHRGLRHDIAGIRALQVLRHAPCPVLSVASDFAGRPRTVVAAIDFSPASIRAAEAALLLVDDNARVILAHVPLPLHVDHPIPDPSGALLGGDVERSFERLLGELRPHVPAGVTLETRRLDGKIASAILEQADAVGAELVTVGSHGPNIVERLFVGSVATKVLHLASSSVLASPAPRAAEFLRLQLHMSNTAVSDTPRAWGDVLDAASERNAGRRVTLEVDDPSIGAQVQSTGYILRGIVYDTADRRVEIMLGESATGPGHLTRTIDKVESIAITASPAGRDSAIEVRRGRGHTLILFET